MIIPIQVVTRGLISPNIPIGIVTDGYISITGIPISVSYIGTAIPIPINFISESEKVTFMALSKDINFTAIPEEIIFIPISKEVDFEVMAIPKKIDFNASVSKRTNFTAVVKT